MMMVGMVWIYWRRISSLVCAVNTTYSFLTIICTHELDYIYYTLVIYICTHDTFYSYERTIAHLRDTRASWKNSTPTQIFTKRTVNVRGKHVLYKHNTQNPPSQPAVNINCDYLMNTYANSAITSRSFIKKASTSDSTFLIFWFWSSKILVKVQTEFLSIHSNIKMSFMETLKDLQ